MKKYLRRWFFKAVNFVIFISALYVLDYLELYRSDPLEFKELQIVHRDIAIPTITLTDEIKAGLFFDGLRIDISMIKPEHIFESISPWEQYIERYSSLCDVDPDLVRAIIYAESKGNPFVVSRVGAKGLMQLMPITADFMGISNPLDPEENIKAGVKYIAWLVRHSEEYDDTHLLWAWNAGPSMINKNIIPGETKKFIIEVISVKTLLKEDKSKAI